MSASQRRYALRYVADDLRDLRGDLVTLRNTLAADLWRCRTGKHHWVTSTAASGADLWTRCWYCRVDHPRMAGGAA